VKQLDVLLAKLSIEPLRLMRTFKHAPEATTVAVENGTRPQEGSDGFAILMGIHDADGCGENTFITFRMG